MREISDGTAKPRCISFRKGDFFHEMAATFNEFQEKQKLFSKTTDKNVDTVEPAL